MATLIMQKDGIGGCSSITPHVTGNAALKLSAPFGIKHGQFLSIKTDGTYSFGSLPTIPRALWLRGREVWECSPELGSEGLQWKRNDTLKAYIDGDWVEGYSDTKIDTGNGTLNPNSPWFAVDTIKISAAHARHPRVDSAFRMTAFENNASGEPGQFLYPRVMAGLDRRAYAGDVMRATWYLYPRSDFREFFVATYTGKTGTFNCGANTLSDMWEDGETITFTKSGQTDIIGYVLYDTGSEIYIRVPPLLLGVEELKGCTVTATGGATCLLGSDTYSIKGPGSQKGARIRHSTPNNTGDVLPYIGASLTTSLRIFYSFGTDVAGIDYNNANSAFTRPEGGVWKRQSLTVDSLGTDVKFVVDVGSDRLIQTLDKSLKHPDYGFILSNWGMECAVACGTTAAFGELYTSNFHNAVILGDAATWSACNKDTLEEQRPKNLVSGHWEVFINQGAFTSLTGKYLYILNSDGQLISENGVAL